MSDVDVMESAGRILLMPKGDYSADATYEMLDIVNHNDASWVCKKDCTGQEPSDSNTEYWQRFGLAVDMSNLDAKTLDGHGAEYFFPKSGGTVTGDITQQTEGKRVMHNLKNDKRRVYQEITTDGTYYLFDDTNNTSIIRSELDGTARFIGTASENLPLTGGEISANAFEPIKVNNTNASSSGVCIWYSLRGNHLGDLGFWGKDRPVFYPTDGSGVKDLLHTGNKPTGTYTGNGDATERTIATGGIGRVAIVFSANGTVILTTSGANIVDSSGNVTFSRSAYFENGNIIMKTDNNVLNASGATLRYQVL